MRGFALPAIVALILSVATSVAFWNAGMPLSPASASVVVGSWLLVALGARMLWRILRRKPTGP